MTINNGPVLDLKRGLGVRALSAYADLMVGDHLRALTYPTRGARSFVGLSRGDFDLVVRRFGDPVVTRASDALSRRQLVELGHRVTVVIGANCAGKTTVVKVLANMFRDVNRISMVKTRPARPGETAGEWRLGDDGNLLPQFDTDLICCSSEEEFDAYVERHGFLVAATHGLQAERAAREIRDGEERERYLRDRIHSDGLPFSLLSATVDQGRKVIFVGTGLSLTFLLIVFPLSQVIHVVPASPQDAALFRQSRKVPMSDASLYDPGFRAAVRPVVPSLELPNSWVPHASEQELMDKIEKRLRTERVPQANKTWYEILAEMVYRSDDLVPLLRAARRRQ